MIPEVASLLLCLPFANVITFAMLALYQKQLCRANIRTISKRGLKRMPRAIDESFYHSRAWKECQALYKKKMYGLCERCRAKGYCVPGEIVHHKIHLTAENVNDASIALNFDNLELLCVACHNAEHKRKSRRWMFIDGELVLSEDPGENPAPL